MAHSVSMSAEKFLSVAIPTFGSQSSILAAVTFLSIKNMFKSTSARVTRQRRPYSVMSRSKVIVFVALK